MSKLALVLVCLSIGLIDCEHFDHVKGGHLKGPSFWSSYKAKVVELPSPTIEHIAPVQQRLVLSQEKTVHHVPAVHHHPPAPITYHPVQEKLVVEEKVHHVEQPRVIEQIRVEEGVKGHTVVTGTKSHHQNIVLTEQHHADLAHERRHEELHQQREQREQLKEIQHFQQVQQHEQIRQQLEQQRHIEQQKHVDQVVVEHRDQLVEQGKTNVQHVEQIIQQKQERNEKLTDAEEAIAEPFPLIPKTHFTCDDKPVLPGMYADLETGCRVYHFCFANTEKAEIIGQVHQDKLDLLHNDVHHTNSLLISAQPKPVQQQMKSFFCGEGTLFNQKLLICDHAVNVICPESIHYYSANLEFGKASPEPSTRPAQLVQTREISKTNHIVQVREPVIVQHHDAIKIVEPPRPIVQVREQIVEQPVVQVRERIIQEPIVQVREKVVHHEPARIVQEQVKGHLVEERPVILQQKNEVVESTHTDLGSFASASSRNSDWRENRSWSTSRTIWGDLNNNNETANNNSSANASSTSNERLRDDAEWSSGDSASSGQSNSSNNSAQSSSSTTGRQSSSEQSNRPISRRFLGEQILTNIPKTNFTCKNKPFENGMYADVQTGCKIYHQCMNEQKSTFLCGHGTLFNQRVLSCDFEDRVKCNETEQYYETNVEFN